MKKTFLVLLTTLLMTSGVFAQDKDYEEYLKREQADLAKFIAQENSRWQDYVDLDSKEWQQLVDEVEKIWGEDAKFSNKKTWVRYGATKKTRTVTDFEKGSLKIEVLGKEGETKEELLQKASELVKEIIEEKAEPTDSKPILSNQLEVEVKPEKIPAKYVKVVKVTSPEGKVENKLIIKIPFKSNHLKTRAERVLPIVQEYSSKYNINPKLVMAVIQTESAFNPKARSTFMRKNGRKGHAYGLMQLVPYSGGKEAYNYLGHTGTPTPIYLYNERNNLELGIAYLNLLSKKYYNDVTNKVKNEYLIICAYNTGPGNVARALIGNTELSVATVKAKSMGTQELYNHLVRKLPYQETRDFLERVVERITIY